MTAFIAVIVAALLVVAFVGFAARRGNRTWTDEEYEHDRNTGTALGNAFLATQALLDPGAQHALEQRNDDHAAQVESEGPPVPGE